MVPVLVVPEPWALTSLRNADSNSERDLITPPSCRNSCDCQRSAPQIWPRYADVGICTCMKVITLATGTLTVLFVSLPTLAAHAKHTKHVVHAQPQQHAVSAVHATAIHATAMHTTQVHSRDASVTHHAAPPAHDVKADAK